MIKTLNYTFEVENVNKTTEAIEAAVRKYPAYISDSKMKTEYSSLKNMLVIRVQHDFFQDLIKDIDQQAKVIHQRDITTQDVAKEFVDLESRLKTKREVEQRYAEILRKNAGTITELLELEFYQPITPQLADTENNFIGRDFSEAFSAGWHGLVNFALVLAYVWPLLIIGIAIGSFYWMRKRRMVVHN